MKTPHPRETFLVPIIRHTLNVNGRATNVNLVNMQTTKYNCWSKRSASKYGRTVQLHSTAFTRLFLPPWVACIHIITLCYTSYRSTYILVLLKRSHFYLFCPSRAHQEARKAVVVSKSCQNIEQNVFS